MTRRYAYLHGFASSPNTKKGVHLAAVFAQKGLLLERPELNKPSFEKLSPAAMLGAVDALDALDAGAGKPWCFVGSSMGGWLAARWAELNPQKVERLVLLCPGFDLATRWLSIVGTEGMEKWRREGSLMFPDGAGVLRRVHWGFYEEGSKLPPRPEVPCPTRIYHGTRDATVPVETSRSYASTRPHVELIEVDDEHRLTDSIETITAGTLAFFGITG